MIGANNPDPEDYARLARALADCSFLPGCWDKRFSHNMAAQANHAPVTFSERQRVHLLLLTHKYRRQIATAILDLALDLARRQETLL